jgi:AraC family transcriptional regulator
MKPATRSVYEIAVRRTVDHLVANLDEAVDLGALASLACLSPFHFHRIFRGMVGETPLELVRRLRMERAAWQLLNTERTITTVAFDAGYETHEAFTRAFRAGYGAAPSEFRRTHRNPGLDAPCGVHYRVDGAAQEFITRNTGGRTMQVDIEQFPETRLATVQHRGPYNEIGKAFERLGSIAGPAGLFAHAGGMVAIYHDDPESTPVAELRSDAGLIVRSDVELPRGVEETRIPAGRYAKTTHIGPYDGLGNTWGKFMGEWLPSSGHKVGDGPAFEIYVSDMRTTPKEQLRTDLYVPVD